MIIKFIALALFFTSCSSLRQYKTIDKFKDEVASDHKIEGVPYILQKENYCGPATLAMALNFYDGAYDQEKVATLFNIEKNQGTFQTELIHAARSQGFIALRLNTLESLIKEIENGSPVIVFQNLGFDWYPLWHYSLVFGYDMNEEYLLVHSADEPNKKWDFKKFERAWKRADYWAIAINPPNKLAKTVDMMEHLRSAAALESLKYYKQASELYSLMLKRWPNNDIIYTAIGNLQTMQKNYKIALSSYEKALKINPKNETALRNIEYVEYILAN